MSSYCQSVTHSFFADISRVVIASFHQAARSSPSFLIRSLPFCCILQSLLVVIKSFPPYSFLLPLILCIHSFVIPNSSFTSFFPRVFIYSFIQYYYFRDFISSPFLSLSQVLLPCPFPALLITPCTFYFKLSLTLPSSLS